MSFAIEDLKKTPVWVNWKYEERTGKGGKVERTKPPYNPQTGYKAQSNNPETWSGYDFAAAHAAEYDGIGFMFANGICGIDIDNKDGDPEIDRQAEAIINLMDTYAERSPSGKGYHIIFKADVEKVPQMIVEDNGEKRQKLDDKYYAKNDHNHLECYVSGLTNRFFTFTGEGANDKPIGDRTEQLLVFLDNYMLRDNFKKKPEQTAPPKNEQAETDIILDIIRKNSKQGHKFCALYDRGDISLYNDNDSSADQALCNILAFWLQGNETEIDSYFRRSKLMRDKWNDRADYRASTISNAIASCGGKFYTRPGRPAKKREKEPIRAEQDITIEYGSYSDKQITIAGIAAYLKQIGVTAKYNEITRRDEFKGNTGGIKTEHIKNDFPATVYNELNLMYAKCPKKDVYDFIKVISNKNAYNPVVDLIEAGKWDGTDRLPELFRILHLEEDDKLSKILLFKWGWQNLSMARNEYGKYGADGALVLQGGQGIGKTTFAKKMALNDEWFADGLHLNFNDKDTTRRATSVWIGELGEISRTFKSDIDALKAFITTPQDIYRLPYGHADEELSRRTSFIGTCNDEHYLIDETGNRRFWTVPIAEVDLEALEKFDALQLYLQIDDFAKRQKDPLQGFRLAKEERKLLDERNGKFEKPIKAELEIRDILAEFSGQEFVEMTASRFKDCHPQLKNYDVSQVGRALRKIGVYPRETKKGALYNLPTSVITV